MKRILIADDSQTAIMFIRRCLEIIGFQTAEFIEVSDGQEALAQIKEQVPDLLVTDLNMPGMDGLTLLKRVKANPRLHVLPVLIISSAKNPAREKELLDLGALAVLGKPVSPASLHHTLEPFIS